MGDDDSTSWRDYMLAKKRKLDVQFDEKSCSTDKTAIFSGVAIFVNGYTDPPASTLKDLMLKYGGRYHNYRTDATTHYIASNLPNNKINQLKPGQKIVTAEWIVKSIEANNLLPDTDFLLYSNVTGAGGLNKFTTDTSVKPKHVGSTSCSEAPIASVMTNENRIVPKTSDPNFLASFYTNSRLHFISTLAQEMKDYVFRRRKSESDPNGSSLNSLRQSLESGDTDELPLLPGEKCFMHVDMDCFFVAVTLRNKPHLKGLPVAVTHSTGRGPKSKQDNFESCAEVASCSYEARESGVKNGMYLGVAKSLCPSLQTVPYDFEGYREVSNIFYDIVLSFTHEVEAVSCDEMYIDATQLLTQNNISPLRFASFLRQQIHDKTQCSASVGIGCNVLACRLATKKAKPNGQYHLRQCEMKSFMKEEAVKNLPGVGYVNLQKLEAIDISTCSDLISAGESKIHQQLGPKTGRLMWNFAHGIDGRTLAVGRERKSVSCDVNFGIRFSEHSEVAAFMNGLSDEVSKRLQRCEMKGKQITLKLMIRDKEAPKEPSKYMGHGICTTISKSSNWTTVTSEPESIAKEVLKLFAQLKPKLVDVRGVGLTMTKLVDVSVSNSKNPTESSRDTVSSFFQRRTSPRKNNLASVSPVKGNKFECDLSDNGDDSEAAPTISNCNNIVSRTVTITRLKNKPGLVKPVLPEKLPVKFDDFRFHSKSKRESVIHLLHRCQPSLCGEYDFKNVLTLVRSWFNEMPVPSICEQKVLEAYIQDLLQAWKPDLVMKLLKLMSRLCDCDDRVLETKSGWLALTGHLQSLATDTSSRLSGCSIDFS